MQHFTVSQHIVAAWYDFFKRQMKSSRPYYCKYSSRRSSLCRVIKAERNTYRYFVNSRVIRSSNKNCYCYKRNFQWKNYRTELCKKQYPFEKRFRIKNNIVNLFRVVSTLIVVCVSKSNNNNNNCNENRKVYRNNNNNESRIGHKNKKQTNNIGVAETVFDISTTVKQKIQKALSMLK